MQQNAALENVQKVFISKLFKLTNHTNQIANSVLPKSVVKDLTFKAV